MNTQKSFQFNLTTSFENARRPMAWAMLCLALCMLIGLGVCAGAQKATYITFDAPGAGTIPNPTWGMGTWAWVINDQGVILGWYVDDNEVHHSYLRAPNGTITTIDDPVAATGYCEGTNAWNLNQDGTVTGNYEDANDVFHGFLRNPHGTLTTIDVPGAGTTGAECGGQGTIIGGRNEAGTIAGYYIDANGAGHGFVRAPSGRITTFDPPGSQYTWTDLSSGIIDPQGVITGEYCDADSVCHGFLRAPDGRITTFDAPGAGTDPGDYEGTFPMTIGSNGTVAGYVYDTNWLTHGFIRSPHGKFTTFDVPGASTAVGTWQGTYAYTINASGAITGTYNDAGGLTHGFVRAPDGRITTFDVPGAAGTSPSFINSWGAITGSWWDAEGLSHGFLRIPTP